jgi:hypothetical protein
VLDVEVSSTTEMAILRTLEGPEAKGILDLIPVETEPWADPVPVFLGDSEEAEEAHWRSLVGSGDWPSGL